MSFPSKFFRRLAGITFTLVASALAPGRVASAQTCNTALTRTLVTSGTTAAIDIRNAGDDRLFVAEQAGTIRILQGGALLATPFLDVSSVVQNSGEEGFLSFAFHPNYPSTPWFFVYHTNKDTSVGNVGDEVLARFSVSSAPNVADPTSKRILLVIPHTGATNHNGGQLQFSPTDGFLYLGIGDGGGACDSTGPGCNSQRDDELLGKVIRIDVNRDTAPFYNIPPSNPFAAPGLPRDEIWAKGFRNPFRMSFDRQNGNLWIGDVGRDNREEVDFQPAGIGGRNYGWNVSEGTLCGTCSTSACPAPLLACSAATPPVHEYDHTVGNVVIGGYVYRGSSMSSLRGCYLFADEGNGHSIWAIDPASPSTRHTLDGSVTNLTTFGEDRNGELYVAATGGIYKLSTSASAVPATTPAFGVALLCLLAAIASVYVRRSRTLISRGA